MTRDEIEALLPFLANDTLQGHERAEVMDAVASDPELQAQLAALRAIRATMQAETAYSPGEMGLARLMRDVDTAPPARAPLRPRLWQAVAAALLAVVVAQALWPLRGQDPGGMRLAGGEPAFVVAFAPDTPESALRALLLEAGAQIVGGPSALGLYQLAPVEDADLEDVRAILADSPLVESLTAPEN